MVVHAPRVSGLAVAVAVGGVVLAYSGIKNASVADTLRALIKGQPVVGGSGLGSFGASLGAAAGAAVGGVVGGIVGSGGGTTTGAVVAAQASHYLGVPYRWGQSTSGGVDCSGLVNLVIGHDLGLGIPGSPSGAYTGHGPVSAMWYAWTGAQTLSVPSLSQVAPGDLLCWPGHIGISLGGGMMINAPHAGANVDRVKIWSTPPPLVRRPKYYVGVPTNGTGPPMPVPGL